MDLDIHINSNLDENSRFEAIKEFHGPHLISLSRTFCNFICKRNAVSGEPELDQIGKLTGIGIAPFYVIQLMHSCSEYI
jgi:hypothetical protein